MTISVLLGEIKLEIPSISVEREVSDLAADPEAVEALEQCVISWLNLISAAIEDQLKKTPQVGQAVPLLILGSLGICLTQPLFVRFCELLKDQSKHTHDVVLGLADVQHTARPHSGLTKIIPCVHHNAWAARNRKRYSVGFDCQKQETLLCWLRLPETGNVTWLASTRDHLWAPIIEKPRGRAGFRYGLVWLRFSGNLSSPFHPPLRLVAFTVATSSIPMSRCLEKGSVSAQPS